jgi:two-component system, chemotaxis family, CheB/CheR fusion protein
MIPHAFHKTAGAGKPSLREMTEKALLQHVAPVAALINANGDILYLHGRTGLYLEPVPGEVGVNNILKMAREGLRRDLIMALRKVSAGGEMVRCPNLRVKNNGDFTTVNLTVCTVPGEAPSDPEEGSEIPLFLVILEQAATLKTGEGPSTVLSRADEISDTEAGDEEQMPSLSHCSRSYRPRKNTCRPPTRSWRPPTKNSGPPMRKCSR